MMKTDKILLSFYILLSTLLISCNNDDDDAPDTSGQTEETVKDIDGNEYDIVEIGEQRWLKQSLQVTSLNDGVELSLNEGDEDLGFLDYTWYENNESLGRNALGAMYHRSVVMTNKVCPVGWKVPSDDDWKELETHLGITDLEVNGFYGYIGTNQAYQIKEPSTNYWNEDDTNQVIVSTGFDARGGGRCRNYQSFYDGYKELVSFYTSSSISGDPSDDVRIIRTLFANEGRIRVDFSSPGADHDWGCYVRCVEDD